MARYLLIAMCIATSILLFTPGALAAEPAVAPVALVQAIDFAGRQRMLSQRMAKAYLMAGQDISATTARALLEESITTFETQLASLQTLQASAETARRLAALASAWQAMKSLLSAPPSAAGAAALYDANEAVQKAAHQLTMAYEREDPQPLHHLLNLAGRQRMLSQRMAKFYLYRSWDIDADAADMELHLSHAHFGAVLTQLEVSPLTSPAVKSAVASVREVWKPFEDLLMAEATLAQLRERAPRVAEASEQVLTASERVVALLRQQAESPAH